MQLQPVSDVRELARQLNDFYRDKVCTVSLRHGQDDVGQARMIVEKIYVDDHVGTTNTLRVVGHQMQGSDDHASLALPTKAGPMQGMWSNPGEEAYVTCGDFILAIVPTPVSETETAGAVGARARAPRA